MPRIPPYIYQYFILISLFPFYFFQFIIASINQCPCLFASISNQLLIPSIYFQQILLLIPIVSIQLINLFFHSLISIDQSNIGDLNSSSILITIIPINISFLINFILIILKMLYLSVSFTFLFLILPISIIHPSNLNLSYELFDIWVKLDFSHQNNLQ